MSSTPLSQRRAPSATARFGGSGTVPTGRVQVVPSTHHHGAQVPLPVVRSPLLHARMLIWDPGARERGAPSLLPSGAEWGSRDPLEELGGHARQVPSDADPCQGPSARTQTSGSGVWASLQHPGEPQPMRPARCAPPWRPLPGEASGPWLLRLGEQIPPHWDGVHVEPQIPRTGGPGSLRPQVPSPASPGEEAASLQRRHWCPGAWTPSALSTENTTGWTNRDQCLQEDRLAYLAWPRGRCKVLQTTQVFSWKRDLNRPFTI